MQRPLCRRRGPAPGPLASMSPAIRSQGPRQPCFFFFVFLLLPYPKMVLWLVLFHCVFISPPRWRHVCGSDRSQRESQKDREQHLTNSQAINCFCPRTTSHSPRSKLFPNSPLGACPLPRRPLIPGGALDRHALNTRVNATRTSGRSRTHPGSRSPNAAYPLWATPARAEATHRRWQNSDNLDTILASCESLAASSCLACDRRCNAATWGKRQLGGGRQGRTNRILSGANSAIGSRAPRGIIELSRSPSLHRSQGRISSSQAQILDFTRGLARRHASRCKLRPAGPSLAMRRDTEV